MKEAGWPPNITSYSIMLEGYTVPWQPWHVSLALALVRHGLAEAAMIFQLMGSVFPNGPNFSF